MVPHQWNLYAPKMLVLLTFPQMLSCSKVSAETPPYAFCPWESYSQALPAGPVPGSTLILPQLGSPYLAVPLLSVLCPHPSPALSGHWLLL